MAVTLGLIPEQALLNDVNPHLMNLYRWVERGLSISLPMANDEAMYYAYRDWFNDLVSWGKQDSHEAAELFYYLNRTCFNGLCRFNQKGRFNVPFGQYKRIKYALDFSAYRESFSSWIFSNGDFEDVPLRSDDFIYADPPYDVEFTAYAAGGFSWEDQERTAEFLAQHQGPVILANQATSRIQDLYKRFGYRLTFLDAPRRINSTGDRTPAHELLATRNL